MGRSVAALGFVTLLALGVMGAFASAGVGQNQFGAPPDALVQFDEQATADFDDRAAARANRNNLLIVLSITLGLTGMIVVGIGYFSDTDG